MAIVFLPVYLAYAFVILYLLFWLNALVILPIFGERITQIFTVVALLFMIYKAIEFVT